MSHLLRPETGPFSKRAKERTRIVEPDKKRDLGVREVGVAHVVPSQILAGASQHILEGDVDWSEAPLQRARGHTETACDALDGWVTAGEVLQENRTNSLLERGARVELGQAEPQVGFECLPQRVVRGQERAPSIFVSKDNTVFVTADHTCAEETLVLNLGFERVRTYDCGWADRLASTDAGDPDKEHQFRDGKRRGDIHTGLRPRHPHEEAVWAVFSRHYHGRDKALVVADATHCNGEVWTA